LLALVGHGGRTVGSHELSVLVCSWHVRVKIESHGRRSDRASVSLLLQDLLRSRDARYVRNITSRGNCDWMTGSEMCWCLCCR
jgi:hypothetical protein